jgi:hypothetical protein
MSASADDILARATPTGASRGAVPFGVNEVRLDARQWVFALAIALACAIGLPRAWKKVEPFNPGPDYRIPYVLSKDYWLYQRRLKGIDDPTRIPVLGDSVVWGEYVLPDGTLSHFLSAAAGRPDRFVNCGVNGLFPLAMEGLVDDYAGSLRHSKIVVHCNILWLTSPERDLSTDKEASFNHARLVPQFYPRIPCYRADANERISAVLDRHITFFSWVNHLQDAYYREQGLPRWTLEDNGDDPPVFANAWKDPLAPLAAGIAPEPVSDPERGPSSPRHKPWTAGGAEPSAFDWVDLGSSLQWAAFRAVIDRLRDRGDDVLVVVGPFNEHHVVQSQRATSRALRDGIAAWLSRNGVAVIIPETLPSELYADASHPLTEGYALLAERIWNDAGFQKWLGAPVSKP